MRWKRKVHGGVLGIIGFLLSPLSWWNDAVINLPLALGFGWLVASVYKPAFETAVIVGYWLTNIIGLVLLHKGAETALREESRGYTRRDLARDLLISLGYTALIAALLRIGWLRPIENYFPAP